MNMSENRINVLIADDHKMIVNGLKAMLEESNTIRVVDEAGNGQEALDKLAQHKDAVQVLLLDINMPGKNGLEVCREALALYPGLKVIAITMYEQDEYIVNMLQAGATGYLLKNTGKNELISAIEKVSRGESYFSSEVTSAVMNKYMSRNPAPPAAGKQAAVAPAVPLTTREVEILKLIAAEMTNQEIADKLFISPRTVHSHRRNLMQKLGVKNTAGLVRFALGQKLL